MSEASTKSEVGELNDGRLAALGARKALPLQLIKLGKADLSFATVLIYAVEQVFRHLQSPPQTGGLMMGGIAATFPFWKIV